LHKIEIRRHELGITKSELARRSGVSVISITRIESPSLDGHKTSFDVAIEIAKGLESQVHTLFDSIELSNLGRPAKSGSPIRNIASKRPKKYCGNASCQNELSLSEIAMGRSECCNEAIAS